MDENALLKNWNNITASELKKLIHFQLKTLWDSSRHKDWIHGHGRNVSELLPPMMIWGPPGVGKSSIVRDIARETGAGFIDIRLAQREPIDMRGLPVPGDEGVHWITSAEWPRDPDSKGIIIFDELTAADRTLQVAAYEFILDRRLGDLYSVPDGWYIMAAGNRISDRAVATTMSSALANRFLHVELEADHESWIRWALHHHIHPDVIGFIRFRPDALFDMDGSLERGWPSPRTWERVSTILHMFETYNNTDEHSLDLMIEGLVGPGAGVEFSAFRKSGREMEDVLKMMLNGNGKLTIPRRADQKYALCSNMVYHLWQSKDEKMRQKLLDGFFRISLKLSSDFATMALVDAMSGRDPGLTEQYSTYLISHKLYPEWKKIHGSTLQKTIKSYAA